MAVKPQKVKVLPVAINLDGCDVYILEVTTYKWVDGKTHYIVSSKVKCGDRESQIFPLDVTSESELIAQLRAEIAKFKIMNLIFSK